MRSLSEINGFVNSWNINDREIVSIHPLESGNYVKERFNNYKNNKFLNEDKKNLLIIGDSFAQDFMNLIHETNYHTKFEISTRHILPRCGNLFIEKSLIENLKKYDFKRCHSEKYYDHSLKE